MKKNTCTLFLLFSLLLAACNLGAGKPIQPIAHLGDGALAAISPDPRLWPAAVSGQIAYLGENESISVLDISDPAHPQRVDEVLTSSIVHRLEVRPGFLYALGHAGLTIFSLDAPRHPVSIGEYGLEESVDLAIYNEQAILLSTDRKNWRAVVHVVSLNDPVRPQRAQKIELELDNLTQSVLLQSGGQLCAADANWWAGNLRLHCADLTAAGELTFSPSLPFADAGGAALFESHGQVYAAVLAVMEDGETLGVQIVSLPDFAPVAARPLPEGFTPGAVRPLAIAAANETLYLSDDDRRIWPLSVADPAQPRWETPSEPLHANAQTIEPDGGRLYVSSFSSRGLQILDQEGRPLGAYPTLYRPYNVVWRDDRAYVLDRGVGLQIVSTAADGALNVVGVAAFDAPYGHLRLALSGERAFAAANNAQADKAMLYAVDIRDAAAPIVQSVAETPFIEALAVDDDVLYLAACEQGVLVYDVAANLTQTGALSSQDCSNGLLVHEGKLYVADGEGGLATYALQAGSPPREVSRQPWPFSIPDSPFLDATGAHLYVTYDNAYIEESDPAMLIYDLADPAAPRQTASLTAPRMRSTDMDVAGDRLYIGDERGFLWVFDVSDPARPALRSEALLDGTVRGVAAQSDRAVVAAGDRGLYLFESP